MKRHLDFIRICICELLLVLILKLAPNTVDGTRLKLIGMEYIGLRVGAYKAHLNAHKK